MCLLFEPGSKWRWLVVSAYYYYTEYIDTIEAKYLGSISISSLAIHKGKQLFETPARLPRFLWYK